MKKITIYIVLFVMVVLQGCRLESEMYDAINPTLFPKTAKDADALVNSCVYTIMHSEGSRVFFAGSYGYTIISDWTCDYGTVSSGYQNQYCGRWQINDFADLWGFSKYISSMTLNMDRISQINMDEDLKNRYIAELRCGRGFLSFLLYDFYGPIVIADLETLKNPLEEKLLPRLSEEEMQQYIVTELTEAAKDLPYSYKKGDPNYGRFTKGLCNMVLLKFYMMTKDWAKAEVLGRELMKPEYGYALVQSHYKDIFTLENEKNTETIWAANCKRGYLQNMWMPHMLPPDHPFAPHLVGWNGWKFSWAFFHTFEPGDQRLETVLSEYTGSDGTQHSEALDMANNGLLRLGACPLKYGFDEANDGQNSEIDFIIYRYADALTLLSEAIVRKGNAVTQEAVDLLNSVRTRAGLPAYTLSSFSSPRDFLDKLLMERAHELYFEGCRRQDLVRDGSYVEAIKNKCRILGEPTLIDENHIRFAIPQSAIDGSKGAIKQNPGY